MVKNRLNFRKDSDHILDTKKKKKNPESSNLVQFSMYFNDFGFLVNISPKAIGGSLQSALCG